jgi:hypothetical protein
MAQRHACLVALGETTQLLLAGLLGQTPRPQPPPLAASSAASATSAAAASASAAPSSTAAAAPYSDDCIALTRKLRTMQEIIEAAQLELVQISPSLSAAKTHCCRALASK